MSICKADVAFSGAVSVYLFINCLAVDWSFLAVCVFFVSLSESVIGHFFRPANARPALSQKNAKPEKKTIDGKTL